MTTVRQYSSLFSCLYDQPEPVGSLGRGTHHSIFRCAQWRDMTSLPDPLVQDFCILWDEDHDERVIAAVERIYMEDLLSPIMFIGERKGGLSVIVRGDFVERSCHEALVDYSSMIEEIANALPDPWGCDVEMFKSPGQLDGMARSRVLNEDAGRTASYLAGIDALWSLGLKPFVPRAFDI